MRIEKGERAKILAALYSYWDRRGREIWGGGWGGEVTRNS